METLDGYFGALASAEPTPGGGSAAAVVGAAGAALVAMVARVTAGAPRFSDHHFVARSLAKEADSVRANLLAGRLRDESAYASVAAAMKQPKTTDQQKIERSAALQTSLVEAAAAPLRIASLARDVATLAERALGLENANLATDLACAAEFAESAVRAAAYNVRVNHHYMKDAATVENQSAELRVVELAVHATAERVREAVAGMLSR